MTATVEKSVNFLVMLKKTETEDARLNKNMVLFPQLIVVEITHGSNRIWKTTDLCNSDVNFRQIFRGNSLISALHSPV